MRRLPKITWRSRRRSAIRTLWACAPDFHATITRRRGSACGYPQRKWMLHMDFHRGGWTASAYLESVEGAKANAARIIGYSRGTHDVLGSPIARAS